jgi:dTDP-glucose 4,6-dehydratase
MITNALDGKPLPVYGRGLNVRDWLYVEDHCKAIERVVSAGKPGETYNVSGRNEMRNIDIVNAVCDALDQIRPDPAGGRRRLIQFVQDRPGHDWRYAVDSSKIESELGWRPRETFETGLRKTVSWYLDHPAWIENIRKGKYQGERLGIVPGGGVSG